MLDASQKIQAIFDLVKDRGLKMMSIHEEVYEHAELGQVRKCRHTGVVTIDFNDVFVCWTPDRGVVFSEGSEEDLDRILSDYHLA